MTFDTKLIITGSIFIITGVTGIILSRLGKPYNAAMFNLHKLIALAVLVYAIMLSIKLFKGTEEDKIMMFLLPVIILLSIGAFISGGILSAKAEPGEIILKIHKFISIIISVGSLVMVFSFLYPK